MTSIWGVRLNLSLPNPGYLILSINKQIKTCRYPRAKLVVLHKSSFAWPESWRDWYSTYFSILSLSTPTVETKNPGDQTTLSRQYLLCNQLNFFLCSLLVLIFNCATTSLTAYLGGIIITMWTWFTCMLYLTISHPGICSMIFGKSSFRYSLTPGLKMRCRYFGIQTRWYSVQYVLCPECLISTHLFYTSYRHRIHSPTRTARGTLPFGFFRFVPGLFNSAGNIFRLRLTTTQLLFFIN